MSTRTKKTKSVKPVKTSAKEATAKPKIVKSASRSSVKAPPKSPAAAAAAPSTAPSIRSEPAGIDSLRKDIADLRVAVEKSLSPVASGSMDELDALRRVLSYLFEARTEAIIRELVSIHHAATGLAQAAHTVTEPLEALLTDLGAIKFEAERFEHVDPLIHTIVRETQDKNLDDAVIVKTIRPGFRTGRGVVIAKALVMINRRG